MNVSEGLRLWFLTIGLILVIVCSLVGLYMFLFTYESNRSYNIFRDDKDKDNDNKEIMKLWKVFKRSVIIGILFIFLFILLPSKETCIEMMIASQVTHENVTTVKEEVYTIIDYIENYDHHADTEDK
jgi:predicted histidine transporter YuiF (NhaC family)